LLVRVFLQSLPLAHQVADFPHERLVLVDELLRGVAVLVEPRSGHRGFELLDPGFPLGDASLEVPDTLLKSFDRSLLLLAFRIELLPLFPG
jgi:hypothetical protein